jgi:hypothetical protein
MSDAVTKRYRRRLLEIREITKQLIEKDPAMYWKLYRIRELAERD